LYNYCWFQKIVEFSEMQRHFQFWWLGLWCLAPLSTIYPVISWQSVLLVEKTGYIRNIPKKKIKWEKNDIDHSHIMYCVQNWGAVVVMIVE
jgi:hypothetical protein